ncbi:MAG: histone deacetylase [Candidatus Krumholzibacteriia bacterium]
MINRETIRLAVARIATGDPEAAYALDAMLADGSLAPGPAAEIGDPELLLLGDRLTVRRSLAFGRGPAAVAERLLLRYGELVRRQELLQSRCYPDLAAAGRDVVAAGVDRLLAWYQRRDAVRGGPATVDWTVTELPWDEASGGPVLQGVVDVDTPALFVPFPASRAALAQVARRNLEFFDVGTVLELLRQGRGGRLFAAVAQGRLAGIILLGRKRRYGGDVMEVAAVASVADPGATPWGSPPRGVGALLLAGAWLLWRRWEPGLRELTLTSELAAIRFYEAAGFQRRRGYDYVLAAPRSHLLRCAVAMLNRAVAGPGWTDVADELAGHVCRETRALARRDPAGWEAAARRDAVVLWEECFRSSRLPGVAAAATRSLIEHGQGRPLWEALLESAAGYGLANRCDGSAVAPARVLVAVDDRCAGHLARLLHLESGRRLAAVQEVLAGPDLAGRWRQVPARAATADELRLVHTSDHVHRIAATASLPHAVLAGDTEVTAGSWDAARLAVGGVLNLLDAVVAGPERRGFAFVRPPGHHARADRPAGFCLFNNVAVGARYLQARHGLQRILIADVDAHHGDGTQAIFLEDPSVLYASFHRARTYPGTGEADEVGLGRGAGFTANVPLSAGVSDDDYARSVHHLLVPLADRFRPELVLVSCGFDLHLRDPVTDCRMSAVVYALVVEILAGIAGRWSDGRLALVLEGGYDLTAVRECTRTVLRQLGGAGLDLSVRLARVRSGTAADVPQLRPTLAALRPYWDLT